MREAGEVYLESVITECCHVVIAHIFIKVTMAGIGMFMGLFRGIKQRIGKSRVEIVRCVFCFLVFRCDYSYCCEDIIHFLVRNIGDIVVYPATLHVNAERSHHISEDV